MIKYIIGTLFIVTSYFDAIKYYWQAQKIKQFKSSKEHSRKFINVAILNDILKLIYATLIKDAFISFSSVIALVCMIYYWIQIYLYYPYRYRGLKNFKRPNVLRYLWNSILPNKYRSRL